MPKTPASRKSKARPAALGAGRVVSRALSGKWIAWSADDGSIVSVGDSFEACETAAARAGFPPDRIAIDRAPLTRDRLSGSGM
jgi:hypothetical protein